MDGTMVEYMLYTHSCSEAHSSQNLKLWPMMHSHNSITLQLMEYWKKQYTYIYVINLYNEPSWQVT